MPTQPWPLLVFARTPNPGQVKTRLIAELGAQGASELHCQLVTRALQRACGSRGARVQLWVAGDPLEAFVQHCARRFDVPVFEQRGDDLGQRMAGAFESASRQMNPKAPGCILIGTDCPAQTTDDLEQAAHALQGHDVVLQPAEDGGYVLVGLRRPQPKLFEAISWGSSRVAQETLSRAKSLRLSFHLLRTLPDLDSADDLKRARANGWID
ncbi:MAG: TIGR04282 family arsenosugar biosynthesis glycosyltransferase [Burkholderiaceae bacterium]|nr:TIGR04282 family arsenosugar biosynthesis glycosyltransferase [Burkholderiaceae bacterium]